MLPWLATAGVAIVGYKVWEHFSTPYELRKNSLVSTLRKGRTYKVQIVSDTETNGIPSDQENAILTDQLQSDGWTIVKPLTFVPVQGVNANLWVFTGTWDKPLLAVDTPTDLPTGSMLMSYATFQNVATIKSTNPNNLMKAGTYHYTIRVNSSVTGKFDDGTPFSFSGIPNQINVIDAFEDAGFTDVIALHDISGSVNDDPFVWFVQGKWAGSLLPTPIKGPFKNFQVLNVT
jgi:hypothetical protein